MMKGGKEILKKSRQADGKFNASGSRIRTLRKAMGLSQEQLAAQMQLSGLDSTQKMVSRMETGDRIIADYELIFFSRFFHVTSDELLGIESHKST